jgi:ParB family chromosome partitioning protein
LRSLIPEAPAQPRPVPSSPTENREGLRSIDLDRIRPNPKQPRKDISQQGLEELAESIRRDGLLQPVVVRPSGDGFELIAGERRWRAAQAAGLLKVPALVREVDDERMLEYALIENIQREELDAIEEATAYQALMEDLGVTQDEVAQRVGKSRATIANGLRLLVLPPKVREMIRAGTISAGHAKALASLSSPAAQVKLAERIASEGLSVRQTERWVAREKAASATITVVPGTRPRDPNVDAAQRELERALGTKVRIHHGKRGGRVELHFYSHEELERVYQLLLGAGRARQ